jgi:hypothetical protein
MYQKRCFKELIRLLPPSFHLVDKIFPSGLVGCIFLIDIWAKTCKKRAKLNKKSINIVEYDEIPMG